MIKLYAYKIKHQPKNKHLFETIIPLKKHTKNQSCSLFTTNPILNY